jgi:hypothetical protein
MFSGSPNHVNQISVVNKRSRAHHLHVDRASPRPVEFKQDHRLPPAQRQFPTRDRQRHRRSKQRRSKMRIGVAGMVVDRACGRLLRNPPFQIAHEIRYVLINDQGYRRVTRTDHAKPLSHPSRHGHLLHRSGDIQRLHPPIGLDLKRGQTSKRAAE